MIVVINPDTGPGQRRHAGYRTLVSSLRRRNTDVLGYVTTDWLRRPISECLSDVERHVADYGVNGVLFDEVGVDSATLGHLRVLFDGARDSVEVVAFNPGRDIPTRWRRALPAARWITFEGTARQYVSRPQVRQFRPNDWHLVHSVSASQRARVIARLNSAGVGYGYATSDAMPNPWDVYDPATGLEP